MIQRKWYQGFLIYGFKMAKPTLRKGCVFLLVSGLYGTYEHGSYTAIFIFPSSVPIAFMSDIHRKIERERDVRVFKTTCLTQVLFHHSISYKYGEPLQSSKGDEYLNWLQFVLAISSASQGNCTNNSSMP
ncbi:hypothetical protein V8G54_029363 [Vigna mungo]|uniref:Uncharacterized protein n=1 Tax=Vigna mungo TaxID=3915 RepID=A0AAQ3RLD5_VIGMU